jgi:sortase A
MRNILHKYMRNISTIIIVALFALCLWQLSAAGWIQGKAIIAQYLLNSSWNKARFDSVDSAHKPWPWADTWPVAKLIVPEHDIEQIILAGDSGSSLAFGPGLSLAGFAPNTPGTALISGHRDTHFQFLKDIQLNDTLYLQTAVQTERYQVYDLQIVDSKNYKVQTDADEQTLVLATCYPFDAVTAGGTLRYLVFANKQPT